MKKSNSITGKKTLPLRAQAKREQQFNIEYEVLEQQTNKPTIHEMMNDAGCSTPHEYQLHLIMQMLQEVMFATAKENYAMEDMAMTVFQFEQSKSRNIISPLKRAV